MYICTDVTRVTTLSYVIFKRRETRSASERTVESGSVGITTVIPSRGPPSESPGRYYVKVVADEESLGETACLPIYCRVFSLSLSLSTVIYLTAMPMYAR